MKEEMKELDIWLAKNLMGWVDHCNMYWKDPVDGFKRMRKQTTWQPTQDIKQAFECINTWKKAGSKRYYRICGLEGGGYEVNLFEDGRGKVSKHSLQNEIATEYSGELPLAICLAIKKGET